MLAVLFFLGGTKKIIAQQSYTSNSIKIKVEGGSNIHNWEMEALQGNSSGVFSITSNGVNGLSSLSFSMPAESLKSESKIMDKNTYKAIFTDKYPTISFTSISANVKQNTNNTSTISVKGKMTISGVTKEVWLVGLCTLNSDKTLSVAGTYKFKMTEYNVTPPSIMFGSIVVTDDLLIRFNILYKPL
jgi:hypothetical protein